MNFFRLTRSIGFRQMMLLTAVCFALIALGVTVVTVVSRTYSGHATRQTQTLTGQFLPSMFTLAQLRVATLNLKSITYQFALARDEVAMGAQKQAFQDTSAQVTQKIAELERLAHDGKTLQLIATFAEGVQVYRASAEKFQTELGAGEFEKAMATLDHHVGPAQQEIEAQLHAVAEQIFQLSREAGDRTTALLAQSDRFGLLATIVLAGFTLLCLGLSLAATRALVAQVQKQDAERQTAQDTLEKRVEERTRELSEEIAERQRAEETLRLLSSAVEQSRESIVITDARLDLPGPRIIFVNPAFTEMTGYSSEEAIGKTPRILQGPNTDRAVLDRLQHNLERGEEFAGEAVNYRKNGTEYVQEWHVAPLRNDGGKITHFVSIQRDIAERKRAEVALEEAHRERVDLSRQAGMAEVAISVLHNVGNVLNSVNVASTCVADGVRKSKGASLTRVVALLREHEADLGAFFTTDARAKQVPVFLAQLADHLAGERAAALEELSHLQKNIDHIKDIVAMQQSYAKISGLTETVQITDLLEDTLRMNAESFAHHEVRVVRDFAEVPPVTVEKHKVLQILVNLVRNAKHACDAGGQADKTMTLRVFNGDGSVKVAVSDNGVGIPAENLACIFNHGFTTKKEGHGFGLHSGALAARELGGALLVESKGAGQGATFTLELPAAPAA